MYRRKRRERYYTLEQALKGMLVRSDEILPIKSAIWFAVDENRPRKSNLYTCNLVMDHYSLGAESYGQLPRDLLMSNFSSFGLELLLGHRFTGNLKETWTHATPLYLRRKGYENATEKVRKYWQNRGLPPATREKYGL